MKKAFFVIVILLVVVVIVAPQESDNVASADMGPKPSVVVTFEHLDKECYVTLLSSEKSTGPHSVFDEEYGSFDELYGESKEKEIYAKFINYKDKDNYYFLQVFDKLDADDNTFRWGYYPPYYFKILIYFPEYDKFVSSENLNRYAFESYFKVDMKDFSVTSEEQKLTATQNYDYLGESLKLLARIVLTIGAELLVALLFCLARKKVFKIIIVINVITQVILNVILQFVNYRSGAFTYIFIYVPLELGVIILEAILYSIAFKKSKEKIRAPITRAIWYSIVANLLSFILGAVIMTFIPFLF